MNNNCPNIIFLLLFSVNANSVSDVDTVQCDPRCLVFMLTYREKCIHTGRTVIPLKRTTEQMRTGREQVVSSTISCAKIKNVEKNEYEMRLEVLQLHIPRESRSVLGAEKFLQ